MSGLDDARLRRGRLRARGVGHDPRGRRGVHRELSLALPLVAFALVALALALVALGALPLVVALGARGALRRGALRGDDRVVGVEVVPAVFVPALVVPILVRRRTRLGRRLCESMFEPTLFAANSTKLV